MKPACPPRRAFQFIAGRETETGDVKEWHGFNDFPVRRSGSLKADSDHSRWAEAVLPVMEDKSPALRVAPEEDQRLSALNESFLRRFIANRLYGTHGIVRLRPTEKTIGGEVAYQPGHKG